MVVRAVRPVPAQACWGYGSQLQLPNALEDVVPVPLWQHLHDNTYITQ